MPAHNDVTGDKIQSGVNSNEYRDNYDRIFGAKKKEERTADEKMEAAIRAKKGVRHDPILDLDPMVPAHTAEGQQMIDSMGLNKAPDIIQKVR